MGNWMSETMVKAMKRVLPAHDRMLLKGQAGKLMLSLQNLASIQNCQANPNTPVV